MLKKFLFNATHWCFDYDDYLEEYEIIDGLLNGSALDNMFRHDRLNLFEKNHIAVKHPEFIEKGYTEKSDIRPFFYYVENKEFAQEVRTSGSSGEPFRFFCSANSMASRFALVDYRFKQIGLKKGDVFMKFWYSTTGHGKWQMIKEKWDRKVRGEKFISYYDLVNKKKTVQDYVNYINEVKPDFIEGYAGGLIGLASYIIDNSIKMHPVKYIVTGAGRVTEKDHKLIEKAFGCKHYDRYGCSEFGEIAHQLPGVIGYEFNPWLDVWFSEVKYGEKRRIEECEDGEYHIFITDPRNFATPFYRYHMKDRVKIKNHRMVSIEGRTEEMYKLPSGTYLPSGFFYQFFKDSDNVHQFQVIFDENNRKVNVKVYPKMIEDNLKQVFIEKFKNMEVSFEISNDFETVGRREKIAEVIVV